MKLNITSILLFLFISIAGVIFVSKWMANDTGQTHNWAVGVADREALRLGYKISSMTKEVSFHALPWNKCLPKESLETYGLDIRKSLKGKTYWLVIYKPKPSLFFEKMGGGLCLFIDANSGNVLDYLIAK